MSVALVASTPAPVAAEPTPQYEFDAGFQRKIAALLLRDSVFALRTKDLIEPGYFAEDATRSVINMALDYIKTYGGAPSVQLLPQLLRDEVAKKRIRPDLMVDVKKLIGEAIKADVSGAAFVVDKVAGFARHQAMEQAIMGSVTALDKADFATIEKLMKAAMAVGTADGEGEYDYWAQIKERTQKREDYNAGKIVRRGITTGYSMIDAHTYHAGWGRRELSCLLGGAKAGKSLGLGDFAKNAAVAGYNVLMTNLEVSSEIIGDRLDAAISDTIMMKLHKDPAKVKASIDAIAANSGAFKMRDFASGSLKPSTLHRLIEKYRADGIIMDLVVVDYADIMAAEYRADQERDNLRSIYLDLRAIAFDFDVAMLTATQTNRAGASAHTSAATDVGDDWNKARTVDLMIGINATEAEKKAKHMRLHWVLARNAEADFSLLMETDREKMQFIKKCLNRV